MLGGSRMGSSMRLSQIPNESQVVGVPLLSGSKRELLDRGILGVLKARRGLSCCSAQAIWRALLRHSWCPPADRAMRRSTAVDITSATGMPSVRSRHQLSSGYLEETILNKHTWERGSPFAENLTCNKCHRKKQLTSRKIKPKCQRRLHL